MVELATNESPDWQELSKLTKRLLELIETDSISPIKEISTELVQEGLITQEPIVIRMAILFYAVFKTYQKRHHRKNELKWKAFDAEMRDDLAQLSKSLSEEKRDKTKETLEEIMDDVKVLDSSFGRYIEIITEKAIVKKGTTLYALGLSLGMASKLTGASKWEILQFSGKTRVADTDADSRVSLDERLNYARSELE